MVLTIRRRKLGLKKEAISPDPFAARGPAGPPPPGLPGNGSVGWPYRMAAKPAATANCTSCVVASFFQAVPYMNEAEPAHC